MFTHLNKFGKVLPLILLFIIAAHGVIADAWPPYRVYSIEELRNFASLQQPRLIALIEEDNFHTEATSRASLTIDTDGFRPRSLGDPCWPPVLDQGYCASCVSFATAAMASFSVCKMQGNAWTEVFSPASILECGGQDPCQPYPPSKGVVVLSSLSKHRNWGLTCVSKSDVSCFGGCVPYECGSGGCTNSLSCSAQCSGAGYTGYTGSSLASFASPISFNALQLKLTKTNVESVLSSGRYIVIGIWACDQWQQWMQNPNNRYKVYQGECDAKGGHAVTLVLQDVLSDGTCYWEIQNSWGTSFGNRGYFYIQCPWQRHTVLLSDIGYTIGRSSGKLAQEEEIPINQDGNDTNEIPPGNLYEIPVVNGQSPSDIVTDIMETYVTRLNQNTDRPEKFQAIDRVISVSGQVVSGTMYYISFSTSNSLGQQFIHNVQAAKPFQTRGDEPFRILSYTTTPVASPTNTALVAGLAAGGAVLAVGVIIVVTLCVRRRRQSRQHDTVRASMHVPLIENTAPQDAGL